MIMIIIITIIINNLVCFIISQTWFKNRRFKWRKQMKTADATRPGLFIPPPSLLVQPSPLSFPVWQPCMGSEHQQSDGNLYGYSNCCGVNSPRMLNFSKTQWWKWMFYDRDVNFIYHFASVICYWPFDVFCWVGVGVGGRGRSGWLLRIARDNRWKRGVGWGGSYCFLWWERKKIDENGVGWEGGDCLV